MYLGTKKWRDFWEFQGGIQKLDQNLKHHTFLKIDEFSLKTCMQAFERAT